MKFYRCKCGSYTSHSSIGVDPCARCPQCSSDLALGPEGHAEPKPHRMRSMTVTAETDAGTITSGTLTTCAWCGKTLAELQARGEPMEPTP